MRSGCFRLRPFPRGPAPDCNEIAVTSELLDHALGETQVAVQRHDQPLPNRLNFSDGERILDHGHWGNVALLNSSS